LLGGYLEDKSVRWSLHMEEFNERDFSKDFLIAEFNAIQERAIGFEEIKSGRINFFLIIVAATVAGLASLANDLTYFPLVVFAGAVFLFLLGVSTLRSVMGYSIAIVILFRRAGRIRRWFVSMDKSIEKYVPFEANDDRPPIKIAQWLIDWRGGEPILLITNATALSIAAGVAISYLSFTGALISAVIVLFITWRAQVLYMSNHLKKHEVLENKKSMYPTIESQPKKEAPTKTAI
jgi:hypothetical protein